MFLGEYSHTLDEKGRLTLPARWREALGERVVVTRGIESCLYVFSLPVFDKFMAEISRAGRAKADTRALSRLFTGMATDDEPDKQGRVTIPQNLREFAGLNGEVVLVGVYDYVEIWDPAKYRQANAEVEANRAELAERVGDVLQNLSEKRAE